MHFNNFNPLLGGKEPRICYALRTFPDVVLIVFTTQHFQLFNFYVGVYRFSGMKISTIVRAQIL